MAARDVVSILTENGFTIGRSQVELRTPIKSVGLHEVIVSLHAEVDVKIELNVARSVDEAERQSKGEDLTSVDAIYGAEEEEAEVEVDAEALFDEGVEFTPDEEEQEEQQEEAVEDVSEEDAKS